MSVAIVSGAARGLGKAFADKLSSEGYTVLPFDVDSSVENQTNGIVADVSQRADVEKVIAAAAALGPIKVESLVLVLEAVPVSAFDSSSSQSSASKSSLDVARALSSGNLGGLV